METITWENRHPALLGRLAGAAGIAFVILALTPGSLGGPQYGTRMSTPQLLSWVTQDSAGFPVTGFITGLTASVLALFVLLLVSAARGRGLLARVAVGSGGCADGHRLGRCWHLLRAGRRHRPGPGHRRHRRAS